MYDLCISYKAIDEKKMKNVKTKERMTKEEKKHVENGNYSFIWEQMKKKIKKKLDLFIHAFGLVFMLLKVKYPKFLGDA